MFLLQTTHGFRISEEEIIATGFHIETQVRFCGCEENSTLENLKSLKWTPEDFMTHHGKLWLGGVEAQNARNCSKLCPLVNKRTTHFTFEEQGSLCQCFSDLHPFHCEEEEGVNLVEIQCIDHLKVPNSRPMLSVLSRLAGKRPSLRPKTSTIRPKEANFKLGSIEKSTQIAAAAIVLILSAVSLLLCLLGKSYYDNRVRQKAETISRKSSQVSTDTVITRL